MEMLGSFSLFRKHVDRSLLYIALFVIAIHIFLLLIVVIFEATSKPTPKVIKERLVVKTINLKAEKIVTAAKPQVPSPQFIETVKPEPSVPHAEPIPAPPKLIEPERPPPPLSKPKEIKKETPKKPVATKPKSITKPVSKKPKTVATKKPEPAKKSKTETKKAVAKAPAKKEVPKKSVAQKPDPAAEAAKAKRRELLSNAQKSIAKIDRSNATLNATTNATSAIATAIPKQIESLHIETFPESDGVTFSPEERSYYDELANRLKLLLRLPEYGEIKVKLTLARTGRFIKANVISAKSAANRAYVEKTLPTLKYPSFGSQLSGHDEYTFVLSLSNDF